MRHSIKYLILGVSIWVLVDYTTAFMPDTARWVQHMPDIWLFYIGYPLVVSYLIYNRNWEGRKLFAAMLVLAFIVEVVFSSNSLLYTFPIMLVMNPLAVAIYSLVTYIPKWITEKEMTNNRKTLAILIVVWITVSILNFTTNTNA